MYDYEKRNRKKINERVILIGKQALYYNNKPKNGLFKQRFLKDGQFILKIEHH